jgi:glycosyltransferase involved in cell wall biosynthesis
MPEIVSDGENGLLIDPESASSLASAIDRFFTACDQDAMERAAAVTAKRYSWDEFAKRLEPVLKG